MPTIPIPLAMRPNPGIRSVTVLAIIQQTDTFRSPDYELTTFTSFPTRHYDVNNSEYCSPNDIKSSWLWSMNSWPPHDSIGPQMAAQWDHRPIGAQGTSPAIKLIIISTPGNHTADGRNSIWSIQMSSRRHQVLPIAAIDHQTPEKSRLKPWKCQFAAET